MKRLIPFFCFFLLITLTARAENYLINGGQESKINYTLTQHIEPAGETKSLKLSFVVPELFDSPTYKQRIENFQLNFSPDPSKRKEEQDQRGNRIIRVEWNDPSQPVDAVMSFSSHNTTLLQSLESGAPFPLAGLPKSMNDYLSPTEQIQFNNPGIQARAK
jgi:hypothetical protein